MLGKRILPSSRQIHVMENFDDALPNPPRVGKLVEMLNGCEECVVWQKKRGKKYFPPVWWYRCSRLSYGWMLLSSSWCSARTTPKPRRRSTGGSCTTAGGSTYFSVKLVAKKLNLLSSIKEQTAKLSSPDIIWRLAGVVGIVLADRTLQHHHTTVNRR